MIKLFIPTYNRSSKLARTLKSYSLWRNPPEIIIFDGSDDSMHARANYKAASLYDFVRYSHNIVPLPERMSLFADTCGIKDIFFMANDEDVYLESFCNLSFQMLCECKSLSAVVGSYLTFWPPLIFSAIPRLSIRKLIPRSFTLSGSSLQKITMHIALNQTTKLPPLFYSPQRISHFREYVHFLCNSKIKYSSAELLHQLSLLAKGDVAFISSTMLLRDETRIGYQIEPERQGDSAYIEPQEVEKVFDIVLGRASDFSTYLNCIYSPPITAAFGNWAKDSFVSSYLTPITPMFFSHRFLFRSFFRISQAFCIRALSVFNAFALLLSSPMLSSAARYYVTRTMFVGCHHE